MGKVKKESLDNGNVLIFIKNKYRASGDMNDMMSLLGVLRDSDVFVPCTVIMSEEDEKSFSGAKKEDNITNKDDIHLRPDILEAPDGNLFFPVFSQKEQMTEKYAGKFSTIRVPMLHAIDLAHGIGDKLTGLVLDAMTEPVALPFAVADIIKNLPSQLEDDNNEQ